MRIAEIVFVGRKLIHGSGLWTIELWAAFLIKQRSLLLGLTKTYATCESNRLKHWSLCVTPCKLIIRAEQSRTRVPWNSLSMFWKSAPRFVLSSWCMHVWWASEMRKRQVRSIITKKTLDCELRHQRAGTTNRCGSRGGPSPNSSCNRFKLSQKASLKQIFTLNWGFWKSY